MNAFSIAMIVEVGLHSQPYYLPRREAANMNVGYAREYRYNFAVQLD